MKNFSFSAVGSFLFLIAVTSSSAIAAESMQWPLVDGFHNPNHVVYSKDHYEAYLKFIADRPHRSGVGPLCEMVIDGGVTEFRSSIDYDYVGTKFHIDQLRTFLRKRIAGKAKEFTDDRRPKVSPLEHDVLACVSLIHAAGATTAIPELEALLGDPHPFIRLTTIWAFGAFGATAEKSVPSLIQVLETEHAADVSDVLANIGAAAVPALIEKVRMGGVDARIYSIAALGGIGPPAKTAVDVLTDALAEKQNFTNRSGYISSYAAAALGKINDPKALPHLRKAMKESKNHDVVNACKTSIQLIIGAKE